MRSLRLVWLVAAALVAASSARALTAQERALFQEAQGKEAQGPREPRFDAAFARASKGLRASEDPLGLDDLILLRAAKAVAARGSGRAPRAAWVTSRGGAVPAGAFALAHDRLAATFARRLGLDPAVAAGLAGEIEAQLLVAAGIERRDYLRALGARRPDAAARRTALRRALDRLYRTSRVDRGFEVPYVAGYDKDAGDYVFVDCAVPFAIRRAGRAIPVGRLLVLHERVEKAILQDHASVYPSAHQIALRLERAAARAVGAPWRPYDAFITRISERISARGHARPSERLDMQPYYSFTDAENVALVRRMRAGRLPHGPHARATWGPRQGAAAVCPASGLRRQGSSSLSQ